MSNVSDYDVSYILTAHKDVISIDGTWASLAVLVIIMRADRYLYCTTSERRDTWVLGHPLLFYYPEIIKQTCCGTT